MSTDWLRIEGQGVLLVGAGGLGSGLVSAYLDAGARLVVADRDRDLLDRLDAEFGGTGALTTMQADVAQRDEAVALVERATTALGHLHVLVHAVGINNRVPVNEIDEEIWDAIMAVNVESALWLGQAASVKMFKGGGRMVFISSVAGTLAHPRHGAYAASKAALNQLMRTMAIEWAPQGISVNAIAPGYTLTPLTEAYCAVPGNTEKLVALIPMGRLGLPEDIVGPTLLLSSPRGAFVTGQVIHVDGGRTID